MERQRKHKIRQVPAGEFKAKCLAYLDEVDATGEILIITKRGRPVAKVTSAEEERPRSLIGSVLREKNIVAPTGEAWDVEK